MVTLPNLILAFVNATQETPLPESGDFDIETDLIEALTSFLTTCKVDLQFFYGDWASCPGLSTYDLILTSETIYEASNLPSLIKVLRMASNENTETLVACKRLYFGLSGGEVVFRNLLLAESAEVQDLGLVNKGVGRTILQIKWAT